ncbi:uncharacterized protein N7458_004061, partial [Penicillium daleae]
PASIDFPPLSVTTKIKIASLSDIIIITNNEELLSLELVVDNKTETILLRKRKRTKTKELSILDNAFKEL